MTPGFIDIHSDFIEGIASPRPSVVMDLDVALFGADRELVTYGVTTIYHSLSIYRLAVFDHKPIRKFENVSRMIELIHAMREHETSRHLIRHRTHARVEIDAIDRVRDIERHLQDGYIDMLSFMDHTPGQGQYHDLEVFSKTLKSYKSEMSDTEIQDVVKIQQRGKKLTLEQIGQLADVAHQRGIAVASHDDDSIEKLDAMEAVGVSISEFPLTMEIAKSARERGIHTIAGAPNVLLGYSHSGNLSACESICAGATDILCSDYYPQALLQAVFSLHRDRGVDLAQAFALVTLNPARAAGINDELGEIAVGKRADLLIIKEHDSVGMGHGVPFVEQALVDGHVVYQSSYPYRNADALVQERSLAKECA